MRKPRAGYPALIIALILTGAVAATGTAPESTGTSRDRLSQEKGPSDIFYEVDLSRRDSHQFQITVRLAGLNRQSVELVMPAWTARYRIRLFGRNVFELSAETRDGLVLDVEQVALGRWRVNTESVEEVVVRYMVYANEPSPYAAQLNSGHAFMNPAAVLMYLPDCVNEPVTLRFRLPPAWKAASSLEPTFDPAVFRAASYVELARSPIEASDYQEEFFTARGMNVTVVLSGAYSGLEQRRLLQRLERLVTKAVDLFGVAPATDYVFLLHFPDAIVREAVGHPSTTVVHWGFYSRAEGLDDLLQVTLEAFLHSWLGGMIRSASVLWIASPTEVGTQPVSGAAFIQPAVTESLWFLDGVSNYYAELLLTRSGLQPPAVFLGRIGSEITVLQNTPARSTQSVATASEEIWYRDDIWYRSPHRSVDHRNKGFLLALLLDLEMRGATANQRSLDDLIAFMTAWYGREERVYEGSEAILRAIGALTGRNFSDFLTAYVQGTEELPYERVLALGGWNLRPVAEEIATTGFVAREEGTGTLLVGAVEDNSPAARAGIRIGDRIVAANGSFMVGNLPDIVAASRPGDILTLRIQRGMLEEEIAFPLGYGHRQAYVVEPVPSPTPEQRAIGAGILSGIP